MKKREMQITIGKDGGVNIEVKGVGGPDCLEFSKFLEDELGEVIDRERTPEFYQEQEKLGLTIQLGDED